MLLLCYDLVAVTTLASTQPWSLGITEISQKPSDVMIQRYDTHRKICGIWFKYSVVDSAVLVDLTGGSRGGVLGILKYNSWWYVAMHIVLVLFGPVLRYPSLKVRPLSKSDMWASIQTSGDILLKIILIKFNVIPAFSFFLKKIVPSNC